MTYVYVTYPDHMRAAAFSIPLYASEYAESERTNGREAVLSSTPPSVRFPLRSWSLCEPRASRSSNPPQ